MATWLLSSVFSGLARLRLVPQVPLELPDRLAKIDEKASSIDNDIYDDEAFDWTEGGCGLHLLNPVRVSCFVDKLERSLHERAGETSGITVLDLGCGAGIATEAIYAALQQHPLASGRKLRVVGVDMSTRSINLARKRAQDRALAIEYHTGDIYDLSAVVHAESVDGVICSDVLEHLFDLRRAVAQVERVLKPGGVLSFDTINRTPLSFYLSIWVLQDLLKAMQGDAHDHKLYVQPHEAQTLMRESGLTPGPDRDLIGMRPSIRFPPITLYRLLTGHGLIASFLAPFTHTRDLSISYLHWSTKPYRA